MTEQDSTLRPRVLVVDDNATNRALADAALGAEGMDVDLAASGAEGIAKFQALVPDCVLLDIRMPDLDGFETCARLRALPGGTDTPIVFLTALRDVDNFDRAIAAGADDFLTKPILPTELVVRVRAQIKLRALGSELRQHYDVVRQQRDDLMRLQLQKERLTAFLVHDLKNPVDSIDLHAQLLLKNKNVTPDVADAVRKIRDQGKQLTRMILNLLDIAKSEEGSLHPQPTTVDLQKLVNEVFADLDVRANAHDITLASDIERGLSPTLDEALMRRVLENLVENALRHTPRSGRVSIRARKVASDLEIFVADSGKGVEVEMREKIFEKYVQADAGERAITRSGRGLGLAFCRAAAIAHGGRIWLTEESPGAVFCIRIPYAS